MRQQHQHFDNDKPHQTWISGYSHQLISALFFPCSFVPLGKCILLVVRLLLLLGAYATMHSQMVLKIDKVTTIAGDRMQRKLHERERKQALITRFEPDCCCFAACNSAFFSDATVSAIANVHMGRPLNAMYAQRLYYANNEQKTGEKSRRNATEQKTSLICILFPCSITYQREFCGRQEKHLSTKQKKEKMHEWRAHMTPLAILASEAITTRPIRCRHIGIYSMPAEVCLCVAWLTAQCARINATDSNSAIIVYRSLSIHASL